MKNITVTLELDNETENEFFLMNDHKDFKANKSVTNKRTRERIYTVDELLAEFSEEIK